MNKPEIKKLLDSFVEKRTRTIVIVDYGNVEKWKESLGWKVGIKELSQLVKNFSQGKQFLRRFYYGSDYGSKEKSEIISEWCRAIMEKARMNRFEIMAKRVKYIYNSANKYGFDKKCDLDVEMSVDLIKERDNYDTIVLFSGDGDLMYAIKYLKEFYNKSCFVFGARGHIGREVIDAKQEGFVEDILFAEDFEYRLNRNRFN
ncbi:NYN domain-containing protein [Patescibacteria group bacterium]|nr:NYN domain-containing protein [Patescibacteria group bacterium]